MRMYPGGLGEASGHWLATSSPIFASGDVWYVQSAIGTDAVSPAGLDRTKPLATLAQAITNATDGDIVVLMAGHTQTLTAVQTIGKTLAVVGGGFSAGIPTVSFTRNAAAAKLFNVTATGVVIGGIKFLGDSQSCNQPIVSVDGGRFALENCYFTANNLTAAEMVRITGINDGHSIRDTTFVAGGTSLVTQPVAAIKVSAAVAGLTLEGIVVDGGQYGWSDPYAVDLSGGNVDQLVMKQCSLLRGSDARFTSASVGYINPATTSGGPRILW